MDLLMFRMARWAGAVPFHVQKDGRTPAFRWASWNFAVFTLVSGVWHLFFVNNVKCVYEEYLRDEDGSKGYMRYLWSFLAAGVASVNYWLVMMRRRDIVDCFAALATCVEQTRPRWSIVLAKQMKLYTAIWLLLGGALRIGVVLVHNAVRPQYPLFFSAMLCTPDAETGKYPAPCVGAGMVALVLSLVGYLLACVLFDFAPLYFALGFRFAFEEINAELEHAAGSAAAAVVGAGAAAAAAPSANGGAANVEEALAETFDVGISSASVPLQRQPSAYLVRAQTVRRCLSRHRKVQRRLHHFNRSFSALITLFVVHIFVMPLSFFFVVIRFQFSDPIELVSLIVNGMEFMVRFSLVLYNFGAVRESSSETKRILLAEFASAQHDLESISTKEILLFVSQLDDVYVSAGSYVYFSKGFLISFYGILVTYVTLSSQTV